MKEEHLIKKLKSGNESALYCIIEQYTPYVSYIVENICGQAIRNEDKEEIISNVFLSLWRHHEQIDTEKYFSLKPYLGSIARNMSKNALRSLPHLYTETLDAHISLSSAQNTELEILKKEIQSILMDVSENCPISIRFVFSDIIITINHYPTFPEKPGFR